MLLRIWHLVYLLVAVCAKSPSLWEKAIEAQPDPGRRDYSRTYFVAEVEDPDVSGWRLEEPMPIRDHWLFSVAKNETANSSEAAGHLRQRGVQPRIYDAPVRTLYKRLPLPTDGSSCKVCKRDESSADSAAIQAVKEEFGISDPLFSDQWHIFNAEEEHHDMNILPVWRQNITGAGITVAVVDDGLEYEHPDLKESFSKDGSWDYNLNQNLPKPVLSDDHHGTRCAGEIAAQFNDVCGIGVAPGAKVAGIRILSGMLLDADEARALNHRLQVNDIYSCSWGPADDGRTVEAPPTIVKRAILNGVEEGRAGKGALYMFAAGNGFASGDNCNYDGYTNSIYSITVAAIDRYNNHPFYGESCSANMVVTYSSNYLDKISTCDQIRDRDPNQACTNQHSGTSAAAPMAAGIMALVLEKRPELTWRDAQYLVRDTAKPFELSNGQEWQTTHDGKSYHNDYGYGLLDAEAIVNGAAEWELVGPQAWHFGDTVTVDKNVTGDWLEASLPVSQEQWDDANLRHLEHVNVVVNMQHERRGVLDFELESPSGMVSHLAAPRPHDVSGEGLHDWQFMSVAHWGEIGVGEWKLRVRGSDDLPGKLQDARLKLWGHAADESKAVKFSTVWDKYEEKTELVHDAVDEANTSPIELPPTEPSAPATEPASSDGPSTEGPAPEPTETNAPDSDGSDNSNDSDNADTEPEATPTPTPTPGEPSQSEPVTAKHGLVYYSVMITLGTLLVACITLPLVYAYVKQRSYTAVDEGDFTLMGSDLELSDLDNSADEFEIEEEPRPSTQDTYRDSPSEPDQTK